MARNHKAVSLYIKDLYKTLFWNVEYLHEYDVLLHSINSYSDLVKIERKKEKMSW